MTSITAIKTAAAFGRDFAAYLRTTGELANWNPLTETDDLSIEDYVSLRDRYGVVTAEMEAAYRDAFNAALAG